MFRRIPTSIIIIVMAVAAGVFSLTLYHSVKALPEDSTTIEGTVVPVTADDPVKLTIPSLSVVAEVDRVGISAKGNIAAPKSFSKVGWYMLGPKPGEGGNAIIDGHVNNGLNLAGVFAHLADIKPGAGIIVTDAKGQRMLFTVSDIKRYDFTASTTDILTGDPNRSRLVLITCDGTWLPDKKTYDERLVVFADLASP